MSNNLIVQGKQCQISGRILRILALYDELMEEVSEPESAIQEIRRRALPADVFTFRQRPPETAPRFSYPMEWDNLAVVEISTYENWLKSQVPPNTKKKVRKAEKVGLVLRVEPFSDKLVAGMMELFNETPTRRGKHYPYYGWSAEKVKQAWATELDRTLWVTAYYQEELVGFIKLLVCDRLARASGTIAKEAHRDKATMNAMLAKCVEVCAERGVPRLVYGKFVYGLKGEDSLTAFKRHNGFERVDVPRYFVPLTTWGRIGLRLGLHHSLNEMVPGPAQRALLKMRSKWYELRRNKAE